jgi:outer membrane protein OmpA-like peptidoglycan-associated protein
MRLDHNTIIATVIFCLFFLFIGENNSFAHNYGEDKVNLRIGSGDSIKKNTQTDFSVHTVPDDSLIMNNYRELNYRYNRNLPYLKVQVRDKSTGKPIVSNIVLKGMSNIEGIYLASDLVFDVQKNGTLVYSCDHEGYFFKDSIGVPVTASKNNTIVIELEPITSGTIVQLAGIEFVPGTSQILEKSKPKLKQLVHFLAVNPELQIEIHGHVYEPGNDNSTSGQKMSEERSQRILKFLSDHGIDASRLTAVGLGSTKPVYRNPRTLFEEQANRRVEIIIK